MRIFCRSAGLACRNSAKSPWGSTTQTQKCSKLRPSSASTALLTSESAATTSVWSPGAPSPAGSASFSSRALRTVTPPLAIRRSSLAATKRLPAASNTSRTVPRATVGARASDTIRRSFHRGTEP